MPIKINSLQYTAETSISRQKIADKPICCSPPNNNQQNPFISFIKMTYKINLLEQTAEN